ncbi:hypothetical protein Ddc_07052 [Ditylenchus destructor]|nr:hypothetical protein Ddc_07052 [Ditylenchus destructor]
MEITFSDILGSILGLKMTGTCSAAPAMSEKLTIQLTQAVYYAAVDTAAPRIPANAPHTPPANAPHDVT